jgi:hypothetical protein
VVRSVLEQYTISDFVTWDRQRTLVLNPTFQRRSVWSPAARSYLIDTILRQMPIPKIYLRTMIDPRRQTAVREIVDGQQRMRAILDFVNNRFALTTRAGEFRGLRFESMEEDQQVQLLSYPLGVDQLLNASDSDVLEVFARLNTYTVSLNAAEKRHARYQGDFKWAVHESARRWERLWSEFGVVSVRQRLRMADDSLMAEMFGFLLKGLQAGDQPTINRLYAEMEGAFPGQEATTAVLDRSLQAILDSLAPVIAGPLARANHFLVLFGAVAHALVGLPSAGAGEDLPARLPEAIPNVEAAQGNLARLAEIIELPDPPEGPARPFWLASREATVRLDSRRTRFAAFYRALLPEPIDL